MRKGLIVLVLIALSGQAPQPAEAGAFATEATQFLNHGQLVMQYIRQGEQLSNEIKMYADMLRNVRPLPDQVFGPVSADINALAAIVQGGQALAYSLGNLDADLPSDVLRLRLQCPGLLPKLQGVVADVTRYNAWRTPGRRPSGAAAAE